MKNKTDFYRNVLICRRDQLPPGSTIDQVLHHEVQSVMEAQIPNSLVVQVKELGTHILVCEVSYNSPNAVSDKLSFRKFFKFQVLENQKQDFTPLVR